MKTIEVQKTQQSINVALSHNDGNTVEFIYQHLFSQTSDKRTILHDIQDAIKKSSPSAFKISTSFYHFLNTNQYLKEFCHFLNSNNITIDTSDLCKNFTNKVNELIAEIDSEKHYTNAAHNRDFFRNAVVAEMLGYSNSSSRSNSR